MLEQKQFFQNYNILATTYAYGRILDPIQGQYALSTSGSSTTVSATTAGQLPFALVNAGDLIWFYTADQTVVRRKVATKVDGDSITISSATTLTACAAWYWLPFQTGTAVTDGWHACQKYETKEVTVQFVNAADAGGFTLSIEIKGFGTNTAPIQLIEKAYATGAATSPADSEPFVIPEIAAAVRVGLKGTAGFAGTDDISAYLLGLPRKP